MDEEEPPTPLMPLPSNETLPGLDTPIIPRTVDLNTILQQEADSYVAVAADYFVDYFVEGRFPTSNVLRANERVGPGGEFKVLVACNVTPDVWERRFADIYYNDRARPRLELDNDCVYIFNVAGRTHNSVQGKVFYMLTQAMEASGIPMRHTHVELKSSGQYIDETNNETFIIEPDIVIKAKGRTIAVLEVEVTHRSVRTLRAHAQRIFNGDGDVIIVGVLKVHKRRPDDSFAAEFVAWKREADQTIQCLPDCVHDFGTAPSETIHNWRVVNLHAPNAVVPENVDFIQQERRADGEQRETIELPVADVLRVALNGDHATDAIVPFSINLTTIVSLVHMFLPRVPEN